MKAPPNINPNPRFVPTLGTPRAAAPPTHFLGDGGFGVWLNHRSMADVIWREDQLSEARRIKRARDFGVEVVE